MAANFNFTSLTGYAYNEDFRDIVVTKFANKMRLATAAVNPWVRDVFARIGAFVLTEVKNRSKRGSFFMLVAKWKTSSGRIVLAFFMKLRVSSARFFLRFFKGTVKKHSFGAVQ